MTSYAKSSATAYTDSRTLEYTLHTSIYRYNFNFEDFTLRIEIRERRLSKLVKYILYGYIFSNCFWLQQCYFSTMPYVESKYNDDGVIEDAKLSKTMISFIVIGICMPLIVVLVWVHGLNKKVTNKRKEI